MNEAQKRAIQKEIGFLEDNMYRYQMAEKGKPGQKTGNGVLFTDVIADHQKAIAELKEGL